MPALQIRDLPDELYRKIKDLSEREHRSLSSQTLVLLKKALEREEQPRQRRQNLLSEIQAQ